MIVKTNPDIIETCFNGKTSPTTVDQVLLDIKDPDKYQQYSTQAKNELASGNYNDWVKKAVPTVSYCGIIRNGCIISYSGFMVVKVRDFSESKYIQNGKMDMLVNKIPYCYAAFTDLNGKDIYIVIEHDNTDVRYHRQLIENVLTDLQNIIVWSRYCYKAYEDYFPVSYDPDLCLAVNPKIFHFIKRPKGLWQNRPMEKNRLDALGLPPAKDLQQIGMETHQFFDLDIYSVSEAKAGARYYAYRAKQIGIDGSDAYADFVNILNERAYYFVPDFLEQFTEVFENGK